MKPEFKIGDGATVCLHTDRHAHTVIRVTSATIIIQRDKATLLNGPSSGEPDALKMESGGFAGHTSGTQRYSYESDESGHVVTARWSEKKQMFLADGRTVIAGRHEHYDYNF